MPICESLATQIYCKKCIHAISSDKNDFEVTKINPCTSKKAFLQGNELVIIKIYSHVVYKKSQLRH